MEQVITKLVGGVGNQFFQYAIARALAYRNNATVKLDISEFEEYKLRNYELHNFCIEENFANEQEIAKLKAKKIFKKAYYKEKPYTNINRISSIKKDCYLEGYWQSEKYFIDCPNIIKEEFQFKNLDFIKNKEILEQINKTNSVSIKFRLKDYINNPEIKKMYYVCTSKYYENAVNYILKNVENPVFYVFSDDNEWVKKNFRTSVKINIVDSDCWQEDFYLMQKCKHNIIANSTFAWACAWLNQNKDKIVIAPNRWYTESCKKKFSNIYPPSWVKVEV